MDSAFLVVKDPGIASMSESVNSCTCQVNMEMYSQGNNNPSDTASNGLQRARPLHGRTCGFVSPSIWRLWTAEEDEMLRMAVQRFEGKDWKKIAECLKDRNDLQCRIRWQHLLNRDVAKLALWREEGLVKKYTQERLSIVRTRRQCRESAYLVVKDPGIASISESVNSYTCQLNMESNSQGNNNPSDTASNGLQRAQPLHGRTRGFVSPSVWRLWTAEEDGMLRMAVQRFEGKDWKKIAECLKDRNDLQCRIRWRHLVNRDVAKLALWREEEGLVKKYTQERLSIVRTRRQCRERLHSHPYLKINKEAWKRDEELAYGNKSAVSTKFLPGWHNHLEPNINREAWTQDEESAPIPAHQIYGNKGPDLTKFLPWRADIAIENQWGSSVERKLDNLGLVSEFHGLSLVSRSNHSAAWSSLKARQYSEDYSVVEGGEEVCSIQGLNNFPYVSIVHPMGDCRATDEIELDYMT